MELQADFIVVGGGIAGLRALASLVGRGDILLLTKAGPAESNTGYAQGGIAAAIGPDDSPELHLADTLAAGAGLCDEAAVDLLVHEGPRYVRELVEWGVPFDRDPDGAPALAREGAHSVRRVLHARDVTGREIARTLWHRGGSAAGVRVLHDALATTIDLVGGECRGVRFVCGDGRTGVAHARAVLLATGGAGRVFRETTNPAVATGDGLAMAYRCGARVSDLEFVQFHPTVLSAPGAARFLLSEALRGEGARLVNADGEAFMTRYDPAGDLAPRDVVATAIVREQMRTGRAVYLSLAHLDAGRVRTRFPTIAQVCAAAGTRSRERCAAGQPRGALHVRRRGYGPRGPHLDPGAVRGRRGGLHRRARRQPPREQLAARGARLRGACRGCDGRTGSARAAAAADARAGPEGQATAAEASAAHAGGCGR